MKNIILLLLFFNFCSSQVSNGTVLFKRVYSANDKPKISNKMLQSAIEKMDEATAKIDFTLNFNQNEAFFFANEILFTDNFNKLFAGLASFDFGKYKYYQNKKDLVNRELVDDLKVGRIIIDRKILYEWSISSETKQIGDYKCFKATSPLINYEDGSKDDSPQTDIVAWFAPSIPVPFGPCGYGDLPGLILELRFLECVYGATSVSLNNKQFPYIDSLPVPKALSEAEFIVMKSRNRSKAQQQVIDKN